MKLDTALRTSHRGRNLTVNQLIDCTGQCPICLSKSPRKPVYQIQNSPKVDFLYCDHCHACSASHMPTPDTITTLYRDFYSDEEEKYTFHGIHRLAEHVLRPLQFNQESKLFRILEFGGGNGTLAREIASRILERYEVKKVSIIEVEYFVGEDLEEDNVSLKFINDIEAVEGLFDLVVASASIHHVPKARDVLQKLFNLVTPDGYFYSRTAYIIPLARLLGRRIDILFPFHVHDMGCHFWNTATDLFSVDADVLASGPSIVTSQLRRAPFLTTAGHIMKLPARLQLKLSQKPGTCPLWTYVGAWDIHFQVHSSEAIT